MATIIENHLFQLWGGNEATFGAGPASNPAATDAFDHITFDPGQTPGQSLVPNAEKNGTRSMGAPLQSFHDPRPFKVEVHARGSGVATTAIDPAFLLKAGGFTETVGGSSVDYARTLSPATSAWLWSVSANGELGLSYAGAVVGEFGVQVEDIARLSFSGEAAKVSICDKTTIAANILLGASSFTLTANHGWVVLSGGAPVWVTINSETVKVISVSGVTATISGTFAGPHTSGDAVSPFVPSSRTVSAATPVSAVNCLLDINAGSEEIAVLKWSATIKTGVRLLDKEVHATFRSGMIGERTPDDAARIQADLYYTAQSGSSKLAALFAAQTTKSVRASVGETSGNILRLNMTTAKVVSPLSIPESDSGPRIATIELAGYSATGVDVAVVTL